MSVVSKLTSTTLFVATVAGLMAASSTPSAAGGYGYGSDNSSSYGSGYNTGYSTGHGSDYQPTYQPAPQPTYHESYQPAYQPSYQPTCTFVVQHGAYGDTTVKVCK